MPPKDFTSFASIRNMKNYSPLYLVLYCFPRQVNSFLLTSSKFFIKILSSSTKFGRRSCRFFFFWWFWFWWWYCFFGFWICRRSWWSIWWQRTIRSTWVFRFLRTFTTTKCQSSSTSNSNWESRFFDSTNNSINFRYSR